jgi:hypothetical protein
MVYVLPGYYLFCPDGACPDGFVFGEVSSSCPWPGPEELPGHSPGSPSHVVCPGVILAYAGTLFTNVVANIKAAVTATTAAIANVRVLISTTSV